MIKMIKRKLYKKTRRSIMDYR